MRYFILVYFIGLSAPSHTQCRFDIRFTKSIWENKTITLKWEVQPTPNKGIFNIYRKRVSRILEKEIFVHALDVKEREFNDSGPLLRIAHKYQYRLELVVDNNKCETTRTILARAIEEEDSLSIMSGKNLDEFTQYNVYEIIPQKSTAQAKTHLKVALKIKDLKYPFKTNQAYFILFNKKAYKTTSFVDDEDYRFANVLVLEKPSNVQTFRIAIAQGNDMIGVSSEIKFD